MIFSANGKDTKSSKEKNFKSNKTAKYTTAATMILSIIIKEFEESLVIAKAEIPQETAAASGFKKIFLSGNFLQLL